MKKVLIVGGKLQGTEACYLGMKAGIEITLIDKDPHAPAVKMADRFVCADIMSGSEKVTDEIRRADMVLPTLENYDVLKYMDELSEKLGFIYAFDMDAYEISSSKKESDLLFHMNGVSAPAYYPNGSCPYIAKPDVGSGSHDVIYFSDRDEVERFAEGPGSDMIIQEYVQGPSYSVEVIGSPGNYRAYEITQIHVDDIYDCNKVTAPCRIRRKKADKFSAEAIRIAELMQLKGIMDFEVIDHNGDLKMLEIDARLPSQTPTAVYKTTGVNYMNELYGLFVEGVMKEKANRRKVYSAYEHFLISDSTVDAPGEHVMTEGHPLMYREKNMGADEVITDRETDSNQFRATVICTAKTLPGLKLKQRRAMAHLEEASHIRDKKTSRVHDADRKEVLT
ncbi:MAG: 3-methylornithine--L-lysine ligase PylC [Eubacteriaceae bacterium]|nr:3-methylornithine--L-lysine ligase PylC [Eubacteriaceae bacterium]